MIASGSQIAGARDDARDTMYGDNRSFRPSPYDTRRFHRARRRRAARHIAFCVGALVARVDRFVFSPMPRQERVWNAIAIGLAAAVLVIMFTAAVRGDVSSLYTGAHHGS